MILALIVSLFPTPSPVIHTVDGPGSYTVFEYGYDPFVTCYSVTVPKSNQYYGTLVGVAFQRLGPSPGAFTLDYATESVLNTPIANYRHLYQEHGHWLMASTADEEPSQSIRLINYPTGWTYCWPVGSGCPTTTLTAFDGTYDFGGTSGYSGTINGVTSSDYWQTTTDSADLALFTNTNPFGLDNITIYYAPRMTSQEQPDQAGHWAYDETVCVVKITSLKVRYTYQ